jgi:predicted ester cyclase
MTRLHEIKRLWQKHVLAENRRSIPGLLATLVPWPVYTLMADGRRFEGPEGVTRFYAGLFEGVPDATFDLKAAFVGENGVVEESVLLGRQTGVLFDIPAGGRTLALPLTIVFPYDAEAGRFSGERLYFDLGTLQRQLTEGPHLDGS